MVLLDTAGRISIDEELMNEVADVKAATNPHEILLVVDALTGQDAVNTAKAFDSRLGITGTVLTRADGDGRGGAALSMRAVTGKPIKLLGTGEKWDALEDFDPKRIAGRILGMGDIVGLVEKAAQTIDVEKAKAIAEKMKKGEFDLDDLAEQLKQMEKIGGMGGVLGMLPGIAKIKARSTRRASTKSRQAPARHHLLDDAEGAPQPENSRRQAQAPHRGGLGHQARRRQQAPQNARADGRHDEGHGQEQGRPRAHVRHGRRRRAERSGNGGDAGRARPARSQGARTVARRIEGRVAERSRRLRRWRAPKGLPGLGGGPLPGLGGQLPRFPFGGPGKKK